MGLFFLFFYPGLGNTDGIGHGIWAMDMGLGLHEVTRNFGLESYVARGFCY